MPAFAGDGRLKTDELFFDHEGNRSLRQGNWKLVSAREDDNAWQLFDLGRDRCEKVDLAAKEPARVEQMRARWTELEKRFRQESGYGEETKPARKKASPKEF